jgi:hypothetical protein
VPWKALAETPDKFLESHYLPAGVQLTDISKMKGKDINECLLHWSKRVEQGDIAFRFKAVEESHLRVPKSKKKRPAPKSEDEGEHSSEEDYTSTRTQLKSHKAHSAPASECKVEQESKRDPPSTQLGSTRSVDGDGDDDDEEDTGKGKAKLIPPSWYEYYFSSGTASQLPQC